MSRDQELRKHAAGLVESCPPGGLAVGLLPDASDPEWAGRAVLALALAAADLRKPPLILDLAPEATDVASRFGGPGDPGFAELADGKAALWEIVRRHPEGDAFYLPCGRGTPGADLARSPAAASLAQRVRSRGRMLLVPLDRQGAGESASAGWVDGFVRLGDRSVSSTRLSGDARMLGHLGGPQLDEWHLERRGERRASRTRASAARGPGPVPERETASRRPAERRKRDPEPRRDRTGHDRTPPPPGPGSTRPALVLPRRHRSRSVLRKTGRTLLVVALLAASGVTASTWLGGPGWTDVRDVAGTAAGEVQDALRAGWDRPGPASDSASGSGPGRDRAVTGGDSLSPAAGDTTGSGPR